MTKTNKKGQAAMEHLVVYGWMLLVVVVVVGALYVLQVFSPKHGISCQFDPGTSYISSSANATDLVLVLGNGPNWTEPAKTIIRGAGIVNGTVAAYEPDCNTTLAEGKEIYPSVSYCIKARLSGVAKGNILLLDITIPYNDRALLEHTVGGKCSIVVA